MRNYVQEGDTLTVTAPADVLSGAGVQVGNLFGVAVSDALSGGDVGIVTEGVLDLPKAAVAITQGAYVYWDNTAKVVTTVSSGNLNIGRAALAALIGDATARVIIDRSSTSGNTFLTATASLDFGSMATMTSAELTITVPGAAVGDAVALGGPAAPNASFQYFGYVSAANTVTVRAFNGSTGTVDPAAATWRATVIK